MTGEVGAQRLLSGRYRVDALLGRGGMSEVYHGYDERLDRPVAIKMLRQATVAVTPGSPEELEVLDDQQRDRARFLREIRTAAKLEHPGTPAVYDTGVETRPDGSSRIWLVMQLLRGSTLEGLLDQADYEAAAPAVSWAAATAAQVAAVLADVHRVEIVHRDIKPANIMIVDGGLVKVLDFGIAILRGAGALPRLTQIDRTVGTPMYMSPEQHLGRAVTAASDVYSLGCLLYELLTGDPPYLERAGGSVRALHLQSPIPSVRDARSQVPAALAALVGSMLAKDPDERPTAEDVYRALVPFTVEPASPDGDEDRDPTRPFRTPLLAPPPRREPARRGDGLTEQEFEQLQAEAGQLLARDDTAEAVRRLENGLERSAGNRFHALELRRLLGVALFYVGELRRAATCLTEAGAQYRAEGLPPAHPRVLECSYYAGQALAELGETGRALAQLRFYVLHADQNDPECAEPLIESRFMIAQLLAADDRIEEARSELEALRPDLVRVYGAGSVFDRSLERQLERLRRS